MAVVQFVPNGTIWTVYESRWYLDLSQSNAGDIEVLIGCSGVARGAQGARAPPSGFNNVINFLSASRVYLRNVRIMVALKLFWFPGLIQTDTLRVNLTAQK